MVEDNDRGDVARKSQLEGRLLAILSKERQRPAAMSQVMTTGVTAISIRAFFCRGCCATDDQQRTESANY